MRDQEIIGLWESYISIYQNNEKNQEFVSEETLEEEFDTFDVVLEYLVSEGFADTNEAALAIMANMGEEWKQSIMEREMDEPGESDNRYDVKSHNRAVKYRPRPRRPRWENDPRYGSGPSSQAKDA